MTETATYTTNLSKAQGIFPETLELLDLWEHGMNDAALKERVRRVGALGKATQTRVDDVVSRGFARRYLTDGDLPAHWIKHLKDQGADTRLLRQICLIYTARVNDVFADFVREVFWVKTTSQAGEVTKQDALDFIERSIHLGRIDPPWAVSLRERVARYLLGTLADFEFIEDNRPNRRLIRPVRLLPETTVYLAYERHHYGVEDTRIPDCPDWGLFGLTPSAVIRELDSAASRGHLLVQNSGGILRLEWPHPNMEAMLNAIARG